MFANIVGKVTTRPIWLSWKPGMKQDVCCHLMTCRSKGLDLRDHLVDWCSLLMQGEWLNARSARTKGIKPLGGEETTFKEARGSADMCMDPWHVNPFYVKSFSQDHSLREKQRKRTEVFFQGFGTRCLEDPRHGLTKNIIYPWHNLSYIGSSVAAVPDCCRNFLCVSL